MYYGENMKSNILFYNFFFKLQIICISNWMVIGLSYMLVYVTDVIKCNLKYHRMKLLNYFNHHWNSPLGIAANIKYLIKNKQKGLIKIMKCN